MNKSYRSRILRKNEIWNLTADTGVLYTFEELLKNVFPTIRLLKKTGSTTWQGYLALNASFHVVVERSNSASLSDFSRDYFKEQVKLIESEKKEIIDTLYNQARIEREWLDVGERCITYTMKRGEEYHRITIGSNIVDKQEIRAVEKARASAFFSGNNYNTFFYSLQFHPDFDGMAFNKAIDAIESLDYNETACAILKIIREQAVGYPVNVAAAFCKATEEEIVALEAGKGSTAHFFELCAHYRTDPMAVMQASTQAIMVKRLAKTGGSSRLQLKG